MAYFECIFGSASGTSIPLVVTCTSAFAGLTITCTDGTTTLTDTCPSSSPYEVIFNLPNTGTWTVSGTIDGTTYSESVLVEEFDCDLKNNIDLSVDFYSAASDTISYTGLDNETHTITTDSSGHATATITIPPNGSTITFTSSVAKDPSNLSNDYSKAISLTSETTSIYLMPNDDVLYWWGYVGSNTEDLLTSNGWTHNEGFTPDINPTYNTNNIYLSCAGSTHSGGFATKNKVTATKVHSIMKSVQQYAGNMGCYMSTNPNGKTLGVNIPNYVYTNNNTHNTVEHITLTPAVSLTYIEWYSQQYRIGELYAFWYEE